MNLESSSNEIPFTESENLNMKGSRLLFVWRQYFLSEILFKIQLWFYDWQLSRVRCWLLNKLLLYLCQLYKWLMYDESLGSVQTLKGLSPNHKKVSFVSNNSSKVGYSSLSDQFSHVSHHWNLNGCHNHYVMWNQEVRGLFSHDCLVSLIHPFKSIIHFCCYIFA